MENGVFVPNDWTKIIFNSVVWSRFPHMLLASYLTGAFCVAATGAWYVLRKEYHAESRIMLRMGLGLAAVLIPIQLFFGHLCGGYVNTYQPSKMAAIEGRWNDECCSHGLTWRTGATCLRLRFHRRSLRSLPAGSPLKWAVSPGSSLECCEPRMP